MSHLTSAAEVARHRTAMVRHTLSQPMSLLVRLGVIGQGVTVFDYGCGQGDDLRALQAAGIAATGWDPFFSPDTPCEVAQVVNLGFVINVIENPEERRAALANAWKLSTGVLAVSSMIAGAVPIEGLRPFADGFLTSRGTFQKYYQHSELRAFIAETLDVDPVAVAPGVFFIFRDPSDQEEFLLRRRTGRRAPTTIYQVQRRQTGRPIRPELADRIGTALFEIASIAKTRGRLPHSDELSSHTISELMRERVSLQRAVEYCESVVLDDGELERAAAGMREDLLVHYALARLNRSRSAARPSPAMVRDIRAHFGSQAIVAEQATEYLMGLADEKRALSAIDNSVRDGIGVRDEKCRLVVEGARIEHLDGVLRCYIGCASFLAGEPDETFLVRIDPANRRVSFLPIQDPSEPQPICTGIIVADLKRQSVIFRSSLRRLLRKSEVLGACDGADQNLEQRYREENGVAADVVFEHLGPS